MERGLTGWIRRKNGKPSRMSTLADLAGQDSQGWRQIGELLLAFALSAAIGLERQFRGKSAGLRTQAIVGTSAALILIVSKYGFFDVLSVGRVVLDPSRVAAQVVSGIGFLGAGLIITRRGAIRGLTTAASVWETAAIGLAAGAGLAILALVVTGLHFVIVLGLAPLDRLVSTRGSSERAFAITYRDGRGVLRTLLAVCAARSWTVHSLSVLGRPADGDAFEDDDDPLDRLVTVRLTLMGRSAADAGGPLGEVDGVVRIDAVEDEDE